MSECNHVPRCHMSHMIWLFKSAPVDSFRVTPRLGIMMMDWWSHLSHLIWIFCPPTVAIKSVASLSPWGLRVHLNIILVIKLKLDGSSFDHIVDAEDDNDVYVSVSPDLLCEKKTASHLEKGSTMVRWGMLKYIMLYNGCFKVMGSNTNSWVKSSVKS